MAITAAMRTQVAQLYTSLFNRAPEADGLGFWVQKMDAGASFASIAQQMYSVDAARAVYPSFLTNDEIIAKFYKNVLGKDADATGLAFWSGKLAVKGATPGSVIADMISFIVSADGATADANAQALFNNKVAVGLHYAVDLIGNDVNYAKTVFTGVTADPATVTAKNAAVDAVVNPPVVVVPVTLNLTAGKDTIVGSANADTIVGTTSTLNAGDSIDGGAGVDTFNLTLSGSSPAITLKGVEIINVTASPNPATLDLTGATNITDINNLSSANGATLSVTNVGNVVNTTLTGSQSSTTIGYTTAAVAGTADAATLTLVGTAAGASFTGNGVETLTVKSTSVNNVLTSLNDTGITKLVIQGDKGLTIGNAVGGTTIATVDAAAATGAVVLSTGAGAGGTNATGVTVTGPTAAAGSIDVTTGANKDTVTLGAGNGTVNTGAGNDTITTGAGTNTITPGTGNDTLTLSTGTDTIRYAEAGATNADTITGVSSKTVFALNLGAAQTTSAAASANATFGTVQTGATSPSFSGVNGLGTGTAISFSAIVPNATATSNTVSATANVLALNGTFTDGTAAGVINALGTTATTGITTGTNSKFLLVTYSVGNVAQIWAYAGDTTANGDIDTAELSLVATLNGVAQNALTASNFATYLTAASSSSTVSNSGQTINITGTLNTVLSNANAAGQYLTAGADTINVAVGSLPTAAATSTTGFTVIDDNAGDGDVMNVTILGDSFTNSLISNIETINVNQLVTGTTFSAAAKTPGTTAINLTGTQNFTVTDLPNAFAIGLGSGYTGQASVKLISDTGTSDTMTVNLNGSTATSNTTGASVIYVNNTGALETATVNVNAASSIRMAGTGLLGTVADVTAVNLAGSGNLTVFGTAGALDTMVLNGSGIGYTGSLTVRPVGALASMDFSAGGVVSGIKTVDLQDITSGGAGTITLAAGAATGGSTTVSYAPSAAGTLGAMVFAQVGGNLNDSLTLSLGSNASSVTSISAPTIETLTIARSGTGALTLGATTLQDGVGTQKIVVTSGGAVTANTFTADTVDFSGVTGTVTGLVLANTAGVAFSGGAGNTTVTGSAAADSLTLGVGVNSINTKGGADLINLAAGVHGVQTITFDQTATQDTITNFTVAQDVLSISLANTAPTARYVQGNNTAVAAAATVTIQKAAAGTAFTFNATSNVLILTGTIADDTALVNALSTTGNTTMTLNAAATANDDLLVAYYDGANTHIVSVNMAAAATTQTVANLGTPTDIATLVGINSNNLTAADFGFVA